MVIQQLLYDVVGTCHFIYRHILQGNESCEHAYDEPVKQVAILHHLPKTSQLDVKYTMSGSAVPQKLGKQPIEVSRLQIKIRGQPATDTNILNSKINQLHSKVEFPTPGVSWIDLFVKVY